MRPGGLVRDTLAGFVKWLRLCKVLVRQRLQNSCCSSWIPASQSGTAVCELVVEPCLRNCTLLPVFKVLLVLAFLNKFLSLLPIFWGIFGGMFFYYHPFINSTPASISNCLGIFSAQLKLMQIGKLWAGEVFLLSPELLNAHLHYIQTPEALKLPMHAIQGTTSAAASPPPWVGVVGVSEFGGLSRR